MGKFSISSSDVNKPNLKRRIFSSRGVRSFNASNNIVFISSINKSFSTFVELSTIFSITLLPSLSPLSYFSSIEVTDTFNDSTLLRVVNEIPNASDISSLDGI